MKNMEADSVILVQIGTGPFKGNVSITVGFPSQRLVSLIWSFEVFCYKVKQALEPTVQLPIILNATTLMWNQKTFIQ